jgi:hypothetical protein
MAALLAAVSLVSFVTGCSGENEATTVTVGTTDVTTQTTTVTVTETRTVARSSPRRRANARPQPGLLRFRGNGDRRLPPIRVRRGGTTLRWRNTGPVFSLLGQRGIIIDSVARGGSTYLEPGRYALEIVAAGTWTITIPRARRVV